MPKHDSGRRSCGFATLALQAQAAQKHSTCDVQARRSTATPSSAAIRTIPRRLRRGWSIFGGSSTRAPGSKGARRFGKSSSRRERCVQEERLHPQYFGEGITITQGKLFQVTWQDRVGFVYDARTLKFIRNFSYFGEGWGLTHDPAGLIMSDGTSTLRFFELTRFQERRRVEVKDAGVPIERLNELEWVRGEIWANVWETDLIVRISPKDGRVVGWIDLKGLLERARRSSAPEAVLNGIAYDAQKDRIFVTGKLWPRLFEIQVK